MDQPNLNIASIRRAIDARAGAGSSDFDLNPDARAALPEGRKLRAASVLVPLVGRGSRLNVILTRRSAALKHHPGQIAFPGGKVDPTDADAAAAALREAEEEIGLPRQTVDMIGQIDPHETVTGFLVTPLIGRVPSDFVPVPEAGEVEEVFEVPLDHALSPRRFQTHSRIWAGKERHYYAVPYGPYYIWGATARILKGLADRLSDG